MQNLFQIANLAVLPFWLLFIFFPKQRVTRLLVEKKIPVIVFAAVYSVTVAPYLPELLPVVARPELETVRALLGSPAGAALVWIHVLAFDLLAAIVILEDDRKDRRAQWMTSLNLVCTLLFGPLGYVIHILKKRISK